MGVHYNPKRRHVPVSGYSWRLGRPDPHRRGSLYVAQMPGDDGVDYGMTSTPDGVDRAGVIMDAAIYVSHYQMRRWLAHGRRCGFKAAAWDALTGESQYS